MMNFLGRAARSGSPARSPFGLGASYVPSAAQKSCQRASMSAAMVAV
ncbi:hypothetical protein QFZ64_002436 [Streptomyces sp. B3I8]|nr:hypothetical protein [Streptomyces sp. B3I8]